MTDIWVDCEGEQHIKPLALDVLRVVESQEQAATMALLDTLEEQSLLESLLEQTKPSLDYSASRHHYLITTPFRYPPLPHGSRFGDRRERGIFYGSCTTYTLLSECAYYRLIFYQGMKKAPPGGQLITQHTSFSANVSTSKGLKLDKSPFTEHKKTLASPVNYTNCQELGQRMRDSGVEAFTYTSARDTEGGRNIGVITPKAIFNNKPKKYQQWLCTTTHDVVVFRHAHEDENYQFPLKQFCVNGKLPHPAV